jgi:hypothetical protein
VVNSKGEAVTRFQIQGEPAQHPNGEFQICAAGGREERFAFLAKGFASTVRKVNVAASGATALGNIVLTKGRRVYGRIVDARTHTPVAGALVDVTEETLAEEYQATLDEQWEAVRSKADGTFVLAHVEEGAPTLIVTHDRYVQTWLSLGAGEQRVDVKLDPGASVRGRIEGLKLDCVGVRVVRADGGISREVRVQNNTYEVVGLTEGKYFVTLWDRSVRTIHPLRDPVAVDVPRHGSVSLDLK